MKLVKTAVIKKEEQRFGMEPAQFRHPDFYTTSKPNNLFFKLCHESALNIWTESAIGYGKMNWNLE